KTHLNLLTGGDDILADETLRGEVGDAHRVEAESLRLARRHADREVDLGGIAVKAARQRHRRRVILLDQRGQLPADQRSVELLSVFIDQPRQLFLALANDTLRMYGFVTIRSGSLFVAVAEYPGAMNLVLDHEIAKLVKVLGGLAREADDKRR